MIMNEYVPGGDMLLADTLSWTYIPNSLLWETGQNLRLTGLPTFPIPAEGLSTIQEETKVDTKFQDVIKLICTDWPKNKIEIKQNIKHYFSF